MRPVVIAGIGQTPVGTWSERTLCDLTLESLRAALLDADMPAVQAVYLGNMLSGCLQGQANLGAQIAGSLLDVGVVNTEASGAAALYSGVSAVASGACDVVAVTGAEKMAGYPPADILAALATTAGAGDEAGQGLTPAGLHALIMQRYMYEYSWQHDHFAPFSINAHRNAATNGNAMLRLPITLDEYRQGRMIADPINIYDAAPMCDGTATVILCSPEMARRKPVRVTGSATATDTLSLHSRADVLWLQAAYHSAHAAYAQSGRSAQDIDLFELHDAFSIMAAMSLEASGFAGKGEGVRLAQDGAIALMGRIPISTMGGLKARGHPVGASGVYQAVEITRQLRGEAGANQVDGARVALAQSITGSGAFVATHVFEA